MYSSAETNWYYTPSANFIAVRLRYRIHWNFPNPRRSIVFDRGFESLRNKGESYLCSIYIKNITGRCLINRIYISSQKYE